MKLKNNGKTYSLRGRRRNIQKGRILPVGKMRPRKSRSIAAATVYDLVGGFVVAGKNGAFFGALGKLGFTLFGDIGRALCGFFVFEAVLQVGDLRAGRKQYNAQAQAEYQEQGDDAFFHDDGKILSHNFGILMLL